MQLSAVLSAFVITVLGKLTSASQDVNQASSFTCPAQDACGRDIYNFAGCLDTKESLWSSPMPKRDDTGTQVTYYCASNQIAYCSKEALETTPRDVKKCRKA